MSAPQFSLFVTLTFTAEEHLAAFKADFAPLAAYVRDHEPLTTFYEALVSDKDPLKVLIAERYADKENAYLAVHRSSAEFLACRPKLGALQAAGHVAVEGESYVDSGIGFSQRQ